MTTDFSTLLQIYHYEGMVALGKIPNPATNEISPQVEHARYVVDVLTILQEKTRGNLTSEEEKMLDNTLSTLRLNFVDVFGRVNNASNTAELT